MNDAAQELGLTDTSYTNPIGLDDPGNRSSARDLITLAGELMENRLFRRIADSTEATIHTDQRTIEITTRDTLLLTDPSVTGIKTGHTLEAGYVLVGSATREGVDLFSVVLGAPSEAARDADTEELLDYGFSLYRQRAAVREGEALAEPQLADQDETLRLEAARTLIVSLRRGQKLATEVEAPDEVVGPIDKGERFGKVTVTVDGSEVGSVPLVAARSAEAATFTEKLRSRFPIAVAVAVLAFVVILIVVVLARHRWSGGAPRTAEERMRSREDRVQRRGDESS
jgi:D-alanyl-D-alanine carboxypeptidase (penicillin-binding protein 5/6)